MLNQLVPPSEDFKKVFCEGMFDKPNNAGFIQVSYYLLMIIDAERFEKLIEWPLMCKQMETKYRNNIRDYLNVIAAENPDVGLPNVLITYLHHASGTKFTIIMWKLSQLAVKRYLMRHGDYEVLSAPKLGPTTVLSEMYLQQCKTSIVHNIMSYHRNCVQMEKATNFTLEEERKKLNEIKAEIFDRKQILMNCAAAAPVATSIKQRLENIEDSEVIELWKSSLDKNICFIKKRNAILKDVEKICKNIIGITSNLSDNAKILDINQLGEIDYSVISELPFPPDVRQYLCHLYSDNKLVYHTFICLFTSVLQQVYHKLRKENLADLSQCLLQVKASTEDMTSVCNVMKTLLTTITSASEETQTVMCKTGIPHIPEENELPFVKHMLLMPSPLIKININYADETNDLHKLLQFTPGEVAHKPLFSKYVRYNRNKTPNLFVSRINIDKAMLTQTNEKHRSNMRFASPKVKRVDNEITNKYSRLFSTSKIRNMKANSSMMSLLPPEQAASSTFMNPIEEMSSLLNFNLDITAKSFFNSNEGSACDLTHCSPMKETSSRNVSHVQAEDFDYELKINKPKLDEFTEIQYGNDESKGTVIKHENRTKRRSISDLVERYRNLLKNSESVENKCMREDEKLNKE